MIVCFPLKENKEFESRISDDLVSAKYIMLFNQETEKYSLLVKNELLDKYNGNSIIDCLKEEGFDSIIIPSIKPLSLKALKQKNILVYKTTSNSIKENIYMLEHNILPEYSLNDNFSECSTNCNSCSSDSCQSKRS